MIYTEMYSETEAACTSFASYGILELKGEVDTWSHKQSLLESHLQIKI